MTRSKHLSRPVLPSSCCQTLLGAYGRSLHESTRDASGNGKGMAQRFNVHIPRQVRDAPMDALWLP